MELEQAAHCTYRIRYHMVIVVKYRRLAIDIDKMKFLKEILTEIGERYWFKFDAIGIERDHFHVVLGAAPRYSPSRIMQMIKSITAREMFRAYPDVKKELWGGEFWTDGGHIDTVSEHGGLDKIKRYVEEQGGNLKQVKLLDFVNGDQ